MNNAKKNISRKNFEITHIEIFVAPWQNYRIQIYFTKNMYDFILPEAIKRLKSTSLWQSYIKKPEMC